MKKLLMAIGLVLATWGLVQAACTGPFCYDDTGASINGVLSDGNGMGLPSLTVALEQAACPKAKGQVIYCSNCAAASAICVSTATSCGAALNYDYVLSTGTRCQ